VYGAEAVQWARRNGLPSGMKGDVTFLGHGVQKVSSRWIWLGPVIQNRLKMGVLIWIC
jgi:hypothetical protein